MWLLAVVRLTVDSYEPGFLCTAEYFSELVHIKAATLKSGKTM